MTFSDRRRPGTSWTWPGIPCNARVEQDGGSTPDASPTHDGSFYVLRIRSPPKRWDFARDKRYTLPGCPDSDESFSCTTLSKTTTLDFFSDDKFLSDNANGVALDIEAIPEPGTVSLVGVGVALLAIGTRRPVGRQ